MLCVKSSHTDKQTHKAEHIEQGYEKRGMGHQEAERRALATVNKGSRSENKLGFGRGKGENPKARARRIEL